MEQMDKITLPYTLKRGANMQIIVPVMIAQPILVLGILLIIMYQRGEAAQDLMMVALILLVLIPAEIVATILLLRHLRPAVLIFNRGFLTEQPISVLGFPAPPEQTMDMSEFAAVKIIPAPRGSLVTMSLQRHDGPDYLVRHMMEHDVVVQLARALRLPVEEA